MTAPCMFPNGDAEFLTGHAGNASQKTERFRSLLQLLGCVIPCPEPWPSVAA